MARAGGWPGAQADNGLSVAVLELTERGAGEVILGQGGGTGVESDICE